MDNVYTTVLTEEYTVSKQVTMDNVYTTVLTEEYTVSKRLVKRT